ncbi:hypothetical protein AZE42_13107 [Rhizopogon vesiculosus]|uniref:Dienelactone hydrolase domain-containing protein n=1 Tax=Rhizopogon vesiculosus TaxID=180088 RepID=A0A1J8QCL8_9AGAM|nr:hypothetical protein AZE42_13107 [Rhizopogon vesiculosus]
MELGYLVLGPDYFFGDAVPNHEPGRDRDAWLIVAWKLAIDAFPTWLDAVKAKYGAEKKYCAVGYCFGAPFVMDLCAAGSVVAGALAHPAFLDESHFEKLEGPLLLSCAEEDHTFPHAERRRAEDIMVSRKCTYYFQVFSGVKHGFAVRCDPDIETERYCFGAPFVMDLCAAGSVVAGALAHPAFLNESHFEKLEGPLLLSCPEEDHTFPHAERRRAEDIMVSRKCTYYFQVFSGVKHGFAVRGDPGIETERWAKEESARGIKEWFDRFTA